MFTLVLLIVCYNYILTANAGPPVIEFNKYAAGNVEGCRSKPTTLFEGERVFIRVNNTYKTINCIDLQNRFIKFSGSELAANGEYFTIVDKVPNYGNKWMCELSDNNNVAIKCEAIFHLRTINPTVQLYINKKQVKATTTNSSIRPYDAVVHYSYLEDEGVIIDCRGPSDSGSVQMILYDKTGRHLLSTEYLAKQATIYLKLTKEYNRTFVDCLYVDRHDVSKTRLNFYLQETTKNIITLHINGIKIRTKPNTMNYNHHHMYNEGEGTQITCQIRNDTNLILFRQYKGYWRYKNPSQIVNETLENYDYTYLFVCAAKDNVAHIYRESVVIRFVKRQNDFYVTGLFNGNILKQYQGANHSIIIYYQYTDGENLKLTCTKLRTNYRTFVEFTLNGNKVRYSLDKNNEKEYSIYHVFMLNATQNNADIKCHPTNGGASIIVRLIHKTPVIAGPDNDNGNNDNRNNDSGNNDNTESDTGINNNEIDDNRNNDNGKKDFGKNNTERDINQNKDSLIDINVFTSKQWIFLYIGIGTLIIIIIISCVVFRNKTNKEQSSESNYANGINRVDPSPSPSNDSRQAEPHNEHIYQNRMDINNDDQTEPVLHYAEIMPMNNKAKYMKSYAPEYAQILPIGNHNIKENEYENIGRKYVNVHDERAEPTYSHVILER